jgi:hypothetical protein
LQGIVTSLGLGDDLKTTVEILLVALEGGALLFDRSGMLTRGLLGDAVVVTGVIELCEWSENAKNSAYRSPRRTCCLSKSC